MTSKQVLDEIKKSGSASIKNILLRHGAKEPIYGVKIEDLKKIQKKIKENQQQVALELFSSGISDAQYLAGLMADGSKMTKKQLQDWVKIAEAPMISEFSVAWVACEHEQAQSIAIEWIGNKKPWIAACGWNTLGCIAAVWPDEKIDIAVYKKLLGQIEKTIEKAPNRVRYTMNGFVIATGSYLKDLHALAMATGKKIGPVEVEMNGTQCKVPYAPDYINKATAKNGIGKKKKTVKC